jgi:hypothetical protein
LNQVPEGLVIVGAGGLGREVLDIVRSLEANGVDTAFRGFLDDGEVDLDRLNRLGASLLGSTHAMSASGSSFVVAIGDPRVRASVFTRLQQSGVRPSTLISPHATLGAGTVIGDGSIIDAGVRVTSNVHFGRSLYAGSNCIVGHDTRIGEFVSLFPGAIVSGDVRIGNFVTIGTGANIINGVSIGEGATVGAGAVVVRDVRPGVTVVGVPARVLGESERETN